MAEVQEQRPGAPSPYATGDGPSGPRAGFWRRFVAAFADGILLSIPYWILLAAMNESAASGISLLINIAYFTYLEGSPAGQTIGKKLLGIRVIDFNTGGSIGYPRAFGRYLGRFLSAIALLLGYLWMLWDKEKQTWHDKLVSSVVVPTDAYPVSRWPG
ncbi:MAG TPA: RDD family protein [Gaiellaceae bacterium]|nr:RDD family protein [Gaiellaceae bacterium]